MKDIPRMKAAQKAAMQNMTADIWVTGCELERELNAANQRIQQLSVLLGTEDPTTASEILKTLIRGMDDARKLSKQVKAKQRQINRLEQSYAAKDDQLCKLLKICRSNGIEVSSQDLLGREEA